MICFPVCSFDYTEDSSRCLIGIKRKTNEKPKIKDFLGETFWVLAFGNTVVQGAGVGRRVRHLAAKCLQAPFMRVHCFDVSFKHNIKKEKQATSNYIKQPSLHNKKLREKSKIYPSSEKYLVKCLDLKSAYETREEKKIAQSTCNQLSTRT
jgi:hypothetical protein